MSKKVEEKIKNLKENNDYKSVFCMISYYSKSSTLKGEWIRSQKARVSYPEGNLIFQQDNHSAHTAINVQRLLEGRLEFELIPWPLKTPELKVVEHVWAELKMRRIDKYRDHPSQIQIAYGGLTSSPSIGKSVAEIIDPTIRFEQSKAQPMDVDKEKKEIYESTIPYFRNKYNVQSITVTDLLLGS
ncbi:hypothetical protein ANN_10251 [Periplaneta americana]|uniref:Tc1-like transposase DDE domain-containing protein n=1 Tax=Periplaneta americana TaxID=6978 RepID=A0ABQ8TQD6_PERAM|nr:hypothetical protein ANN_10251 [Periplaneta americana]